MRCSSCHPVSPYASMALRRERGGFHLTPCQRESITSRLVLDVTATSCSLHPVTPHRLLSCPREKTTLQFFGKYRRASLPRRMVSFSWRCLSARRFFACFVFQHSCAKRRHDSPVVYTQRAASRIGCLYKTPVGLFVKASITLVYGSPLRGFREYPIMPR